MKMLKDHVTEKGEMVLILDDPALLETEKEMLFMRKPLESLGKNESGKECPPAPAVARIRFPASKFGNLSPLRPRFVAIKSPWMGAVFASH